MIANKLDEVPAQFVDDRDLRDSVTWLQTFTPYFFNNADFEITLLPSADGENLLALKVYSALDSSTFRSRRHQICTAMLAGNYRTLYDAIGIFQRRRQETSPSMVSASGSGL